MNEWTMRPIGYIRSPYKETREIPKGLGAEHTAEGILEILPEYEPGLKDIEGFSHLFVLWVFHKAAGIDLEGTPPSDNRPHGVFATRSPRRPNPIGLSVVELLRREGSRLHLRRVDMLDGTPVLHSQGNPVPTYTQTTVNEFTRVLTGWRFQTAFQSGVTNYRDPMVPRGGTNHDTGSKTLYSTTLAGCPGANNVTNPTNAQCAQNELNAALDVLNNHSNTAPFISKQLIQHLVTSNPSPAYVQRVASVFNSDCNGLYPESPCGAHGNLKAVVRNILLDPEGVRSLREQRRGTSGPSRRSRSRCARARSWGSSGGMARARALSSESFRGSRSRPGGVP